MQVYILPAISGPIISGMEHSPSTKPIPCDAPTGPHICTAMGPNRVEKQPSNKPMANENTINDV